MHKDHVNHANGTTYRCVYIYLYKSSSLCAYSSTKFVMFFYFEC